MDDLAAAQDGDGAAFDRLVAPHRSELIIHAYRVLGSRADAEDAVQDAMLAAWRGLGGLRARSALRAWLYTTTTRAALRAAERAGPRLLSWEAATAADPGAELADPVDRLWIDPLPTPADLSLRREHIELAWLAALQRLPPLQRAAVVLKDALSFSSVEIAALLDTSRPAVDSALQRARSTLKGPSRSPASGPSDADRAVAAEFARAFAEADVDAVVALLADDVRFTMPPLPAWFDGVSDVASFLRHRVLATPWRVSWIDDVNGHPALLGHQLHEGSWRRGAIMVLHIDAGAVRWIATFIDPDLVARWPIPGGFTVDR
ncbi:RNA polymerase subunit sigma-70 [Microbacterium sp. NPDC089695]|uniref:RNA polymerase subunit sigma-70 n=1 Tax=Microbacterium sp. NPDC089695 TaxID=3364198 RepID=UPI003810BE8D